MGNFNFECGKCGWGPNGTGEDGRDYFGKPAQVFAVTKDGKEVCMNGEYTGYGIVELPGGQEFYLKQFDQFWAGWLGATDPVCGPFVGGEILCEECCWGSIPTPMTKFGLSDFQTVKEYLEKSVAAPVSAPVSAAKPKPKAAKPKALTKEQLAAKVAELEAEEARLKPMEKRLADLDRAYTTLHEKYQVAAKRLDKIKNALWGYDD